MSLDEANRRIDLMEAELAKDVECARLFRLLTKLCTVVDRAELNGDESWSEYGDRYMLKLFRDYVFHQVPYTVAFNSLTKAALKIGPPNSCPDQL